MLRFSFIKIQTIVKALWNSIYYYQKNSYKNIYAPDPEKTTRILSGIFVILLVSTAVKRFSFNCLQKHSKVSQFKVRENQSYCLQSPAKYFQFSAFGPNW